MSDNTDTEHSGAIDRDFDEAELSYDQRVESVLRDVQQDPQAGGIAIDLITRQAVFVRQQTYDNCRDHYEEEGYCLVTYKGHPWLPGISVENAVYECSYIDGNPQNAHKQGKTYEFPSARLMALPIELSWDEYEVGDV